MNDGMMASQASAVGRPASAVGRPVGAMEGEEEPRVLTLLGPCAAAELGWTLAAEHLAHNSASLFAPATADPLAPPTLAEMPLEMGILADVRRQPFANLPNLQLDAKDAPAELTRFARAGGATLVESTPRSRRSAGDVAALVALAASAAPHVRLVLGTGCVAQDEAGTAQDELAAAFERDLKVSCLPDAPAPEAAAGCSWVPRAGLIGEIVLGPAPALDEADMKSLRAAARAQCRTHAPLLVTIPARRAAGYAQAVLELLLAESVSAAKVLVAGLAQTAEAADGGESDMLAVLGQGSTLVVGVPGAEVLLPEQQAPARTEEEAAALVARLCAHRPENADRIVLAQGLTFRTQLASYGGEGLSLPTTFPPRLRRHGLSDSGKTAGLGCVSDGCARPDLCGAAAVSAAQHHDGEHGAAAGVVGPAAEAQDAAQGQVELLPLRAAEGRGRRFLQPARVSVLQHCVLERPPRDGRPAGRQRGRGRQRAGRPERRRRRGWHRLGDRRWLLLNASVHSLP